MLRRSVYGSVSAVSSVISAFAIASAAASVAGCSSANDSSPSAALSPDSIVGHTSKIEVCNTSAAPSATTLRCQAGSTAARVALAICGDLVADNTLTLPSPGANLLVRGMSTTSAPLVVTGDFASGGSIDARNTQTVGGDLSTGGDWTTSAPVIVKENATVTGMLEASNTVTVAGTLTSASVSTSQASAVQAGTIVHAPGAFVPSLDCDHRPNLGSMIGSAQASVSLDASDALPLDALVDVNGATDLTLGCGPYALSAIAVYAPLTLHVNAPTVLMVAGDLTIAAPLVIDVAEGASLDLVVGGDVNVNNTFTVGDASAPSSTWLAVGGALTVAAPLNVGGSLFVAGATAANNTMVISGAAYLGSLHVAAPVQVDGGAAPLVGFAGDGCFSGPSGG